MFGLFKKKIVSAGMVSDTSIPASLGPVELGDIARDVVTGFIGLVESRTLFLHGCDRLVLDPIDLGEDGKPKDTFAFDVMRLEVVEKRRLTPVALPPIMDELAVGYKVKDKLTGYEGIASDITLFLNGMVIVGIENLILDKEQMPRKSKPFALNRIEVLEHREVPVVPSAEPVTKRGGPVERMARR